MKELLLVIILLLFIQCSSMNITDDFRRTIFGSFTCFSNITSNVYSQNNISEAIKLSILRYSKDLNMNLNFTINKIELFDEIQAEISFRLITNTNSKRLNNISDEEIISNSNNFILDLISSSTFNNNLYTLINFKVNTTSLKFVQNNNYVEHLNDPINNFPSSSPTFSDISVNFYFLGDWGKGGIAGDITAVTSRKLPSNDHPEHDHNGHKHNDFTYQYAIGKAMIEFATTIQPDFVIALGDNFYTNGVSSTSDSMWNTNWKNIYLPNNGTTNPLSIPWFPVFGNHDYGYGESGLQAQLDRSTSTDDDTWQFEAKNYTKLFKIENGVSIQLIFIDTTTLAPSTNKATNEEGGVSTEEQADRISNQLYHIEKYLQEAKLNNATYTIVAGHYPIVSPGKHGDNSELVQNLLPLLVKYKVNVYYCGHDHINAHMTMEDNDIQFIISGSGSMIDSVRTSALANTTWSGQGYAAFSVVTANIFSLDIKFVNINSEIVYNFALVNPDINTLINPNDLLTSNPVDNQTIEKEPTVASENRNMINYIYVGILFLFILTIFCLLYYFIDISIYKEEEEEDLLLKNNNRNVCKLDESNMKHNIEV